MQYSPSSPPDLEGVSSSLKVEGLGGANAQVLLVKLLNRWNLLHLAKEHPLLPKRFNHSFLTSLLQGDK
jgi:hypothetical protein